MALSTDYRGTLQNWRQGQDGEGHRGHGRGHFVSAIFAFSVKEVLLRAVAAAKATGERGIFVVSLNDENYVGNSDFVLLTNLLQQLYLEHGWEDEPQRDDGVRAYGRSIGACQAQGRGAGQAVWA